MHKSKLDLLGNLISPSGLSLAFTGIISALFLVIGASNFLGTATPFYRLLLGNQASGELVDITKQNFLIVFKLFDNPWLNNLLLFAFWALVGLVIWILLNNSASLFSEIGEDLQEVTYTGSQPQHNHSALVQTFKQAMYHIAILVIISVYVVFFWTIVLPWLIAVYITGVGSTFTASGLLAIAAAIYMMMLALHILTILFRLLFLRTRLFGD
jgi:hypothetical protein